MQALPLASHQAAAAAESRVKQIESLYLTLLTPTFDSPSLPRRLSGGSGARSSPAAPAFRSRPARTTRSPSPTSTSSTSSSRYTHCDGRRERQNKTPKIKTPATKLPQENFQLQEPILDQLNVTFSIRRETRITRCVSWGQYTSSPLLGSDATLELKRQSKTPSQFRTRNSHVVCDLVQTKKNIRCVQAIARRPARLGVDY